MSKDKVTAYKFTNRAGRHFFVREPEIADMETVARLVGDLKENQSVIALRSQEEMAKTLLLGVQEKDNEDGSQGKKMEVGITFNVKTAFTLKEYTFLLKCIQKLTEEEEEGNDPELVML